MEPDLGSMLEGKNCVDREEVYLFLREMQLAFYGWPDALIKACHDPFEYELQLRTGTVVRFVEARPINRDWVHIEVGDRDQKCELSRFERGIDVRLSDIVYVADAPDGS